jgi:hypothetical protein
VEDSNATTLIAPQVDDRRHGATLIGNHPPLLASKVERQHDVANNQAGEESCCADLVNRRIYSGRVGLEHLPHSAAMLPEMNASQRSLLRPRRIESRAVLVGACVASVHSFILTARQTVHVSTPYRITAQKALCHAHPHHPYRQSGMRRYANILIRRLMKEPCARYAIGIGSLKRPCYLSL